MENSKMYQNSALARIDKDPALKRLKHLKSFQWDNDPHFWQWLTTASVSAIQAKTEFLQVYTLKRVAYHEAGHAVTAYLTNGNFSFATIVPTPGNPYMAMVSGDNSIGKHFGLLSFATWRMIAIYLAGATAEEYYTRSLFHGFEYEVAKAVMLIRCLPNPEDHNQFKVAALFGLHLLLQQPAVWKAIEVVAALLYEKGTLSSEQIAEVVENQVRCVKKMPDLLKSFRLQAKKEDELLAMVAEGNPNAIKAVDELEEFFWKEMVKFVGQKKMSVPSCVYQEFTNEQYWNMDIDELKYLTGSKNPNLFFHRFNITS